jgi:hypothetical protein
MRFEVIMALPLWIYNTKKYPHFALFGGDLEKNPALEKSGCGDYII